MRTQLKIELPKFEIWSKIYRSTNECEKDSLGHYRLRSEERSIDRAYHKVLSRTPVISPDNRE